MHEAVNYQSIWGRLYILLGTLFSLLFIFGALILNDFTIFLNLIASAIVIYVGYGMLKRPYAKYNNTELIVFGLTGAIRKHYYYTSPSSVILKKNNLFLDGKKLKINKWIIDKADWNRLVQFYDTELADLEELQD